MTTIDVLENVSPSWMSNQHDDVLWVRLQVVRNIKGQRFPQRMKENERREALQQVQKAVDRWNRGHTSSLTSFPVMGFSANERELLEHKLLLLPNFPCYREYMEVFVNEPQDVSLIANGYDHICIQCMGASAQVGTLWDKAVSIEAQLGQDVEYAFDKEFGYLTAYPQLAGTGLRLTAALFLPGIARTGMVPDMAENAARAGFSFQPVQGRMEESSCPCFVLMNRVTLGVTEQELCRRMNQLLLDIGRTEALVWGKLWQADELKIKDSIWRALGTLKYARILGQEEALRCAAFLQMGMKEQVLPARDSHLFTKLLLAASSPYVRAVTHKESMDENEVNVWRAMVLRDLITGAGL